MNNNNNDQDLVKSIDMTTSIIINKLDIEMNNLDTNDNQYKDQVSNINLENQKDINKITLHNKVLKSVDSQLEAIGDEHKYQINIFIIFAFQWIFATILLLGQPFIFKPPVFLCDDPQKPGHKMECTELDGGCDQRILKPDLPNSVTMEFGLYCENQWLKYACACLFFIGTCVFSLVFAQYAEIGGRKKALFWSYSLGVVSIFISTFFTNFWWFAIFYTFSGGGFFAYTTVTYVLISETTSAKYMQYSTVGLLLIWAFSEMLLPLGYYFVPDWRNFLRLIIALPAFLALVFFNWIYESPRYLIIKKDYIGLLQIMKKIAEINGRIFSENMMIQPEESKSPTTIESVKNQDDKNDDNEIKAVNKPKNYTFHDLWRFNSLRIITIQIGILVFVSNFCYYGSMFALPNLRGNFYWNGFYLALSEYIAYVITSPIIRLFNRKVSLTLTFILTMIFSSFFIIYTRISKTSSSCKSDNEDEICVYEYMETTMAIIIKFMVSITNCILYVYSNEIYPTAVRSLGLGMGSFFGCIGSIFASLNEEISNMMSISPMILFIILPGISLIYLKKLPETRGKPLEDDVLEEKIESKKNLNNQVILLDQKENQISKEIIGIDEDTKNKQEEIDLNNVIISGEMTTEDKLNDEK